MTSISNLEQSLATLEPRSHGTYFFESVESIPTGLEPFVVVREDEGITLVVAEKQAKEFGLSLDEPFTRISLGAFTSLDAVGITATVSQTLASREIPCNVVAGYHHDHIFVPKTRSSEAMNVLQHLSANAQGWLPK